MGQYIAGLAGDPCAYLNNAGNSVESVDQNSSPGECTKTGGQWLPAQPPGTIYGVDANGNAYAQPPSLWQTFISLSRCDQAVVAGGGLIVTGAVTQGVGAGMILTGVGAPGGAVAIEVGEGMVLTGEGVVAIGVVGNLLGICH
jgi:hypothetical protein